ncbi:MAG: serine--tRNA ligase [Dehalococcoidales bacterium]|jgi:seryl-tRNA synthetase|nr:serine--tRNA ligase [Dehalococcoidales bacterium]MDP6576744.1 serine--tRNA ligase [Dehalococcoidales bacterium]MDP6824895.1 serine--tRNA ligase [Dehalococcoidales bacterium]
MLDLKFIREDTAIVREALEKRQDSAPLDEILLLDATRRQKILELENLRHTRKTAARERQTDRTTTEEGRDRRALVRNLEEEVKSRDSELTELLLQVPNIPHPSVPTGKGEDDNVVIRSWGEPKRLAFSPTPHWELGESLDIIDFERGVKLAGSRFYVLKGAGARLQRALIWFMLDLHTTRHGYQEAYLPFMVKRECMVGSSNLPKFADNLYHDETDDFWFVPTAEVPITNLHRKEIIPPGSLPFYYTSYTPCFRREKMSAGKDTRGIKRGHQFDKVELYKYTDPETSYEELEKMLNDAEEVCRQLGLPYRVSQLCTAELGFASAKSYDIEIWDPGCEEWLEVSSCSNCTDFQARRANIRYRPTSEVKPRFVHTLNGSGLALPRVLIAIMGNYQQVDGSIIVPEVLQPFMGTKVIR